VIKRREALYQFDLKPSLAAKQRVRQ